MSAIPMSCAATRGGHARGQAMREVRVAKESTMRYRRGCHRAAVWPALLGYQSVIEAVKPLRDRRADGR